MVPTVQEEGGVGALSYPPNLSCISRGKGRWGILLSIRNGNGAERGGGVSPPSPPPFRSNQEEQGRGSPFSISRNSFFPGMDFSLPPNSILPVVRIMFSKNSIFEYIFTLHSLLAMYVYYMFILIRSRRMGVLTPPLPNRENRGGGSDLTPLSPALPKNPCGDRGVGTPPPFPLPCTPGSGSSSPRGEGAARCPQSRVEGWGGGVVRDRPSNPYLSPRPTPLSPYTPLLFPPPTPL